MKYPLLASLVFMCSCTTVLVCPHGEYDQQQENEFDNSKAAVEVKKKAVLFIPAQHNQEPASALSPAPVVPASH